jgi:hypothetical protein
MCAIVAESFEALSEHAADFFARRIAETPAANSMPVTGITPMGVYRSIAARKERGDIDAIGLKLFRSVNIAHSRAMTTGHCSGG